jgi:hypothetical protein
MVASIILKDLRWPFATEAVVASAAAGAFFAGYALFSRTDARRKVAIINVLACLAWAFSSWLLYANEGTGLRADGVFSQWGRWLGYAVAYSAASTSLLSTLIVHNWAKELLVAGTGILSLLAYIASSSSSNAAQLVCAVAGGLVISFLVYIHALNIYRKDWVGYSISAAVVLVFVALSLVFFFGPECRGALTASLEDFNHVTYSWLLAAITAVMVIIVPAFAWIYTESEVDYCTRNGIPLHQHLSVGDGTAVQMIPNFGAINA